MSFSLEDLKKKNGLETAKFKPTGKGAITTSSSSISALRSSMHTSHNTNLDTRVKSGAALNIASAGVELSKKATELIFIIDKSKSTSGLEEPTIKALEDFIAKEKSGPYPSKVTIILFDRDSEIVVDRCYIKNVPSFSYRADGSWTSLYDVLYKQLNYLKNRQLASKDINPKNTIVTIMTDGNDNASTYNIIDARNIIETCKQLGWKFIFLGANIDAKLSARNLGIDPDLAENYRADAHGLFANLEAVRKALSDIRESGTIKPNWSEGIKQYNNLSLGTGKNNNGNGTQLRLTGGKK